MASWRIQLGPNAVVPFGAAVLNGCEARRRKSASIVDKGLRQNPEDVVIGWDYDLRKRRWRRRSTIVEKLRSRSRMRRIA